MTCDFRWIVSSVAHLPAAACTTWAPGSKPPLGRGGEVGQRALRVLMVFPVVSVRLCAVGPPCRSCVLDKAKLRRFETGVTQMSIHSIQIDQSMQNWQVSGGSAYWFRCIPNRLGCIATFLISKAPRSCTIIFSARTALAGAGAAASSASSASVASAALHASSTLRDGEHAYQQFSSQLTTARRVVRAGGASRPHARYALGALGNR